MNMQYRLDRKGRKNSALGFGCMRFPSSFEKSEELILKAVENGVNYLDTAYVYPGSEVVVGKILQKNDLRDKVLLATKLPQSKMKSIEEIDKVFAEQQERLHTSRFDNYLMHSFSDFEQWERLQVLGIEKWIQGKQASGEIDAIGFSFHGQLSDFKKLVDAYDWDFCQIQYNYVNTNYQAGREGLQYAGKKGLAITIMEPLLGGKLADPPKQVAQILHRVHPDWSPAAWSFNWLWDQPEVTCILSGMNAMSQLDENLRLASAAEIGMMTPAEHQTIVSAQTAFDRSKKIDCTACAYCLPCPQNINIPACFAAYNASYTHGLASGFMQHYTSIGAMSENPHWAGNCIKCGICETRCPQNLPIRANMRKVAKKFENPVIKFAVKKFA